MKRIFFLFVGFIAVGSCGGNKSLFSNSTDYIGGNQAAAIELACHKRGSAAKNSVAYDLCVQSQKIHYNYK